MAVELTFDKNDFYILKNGSLISKIADCFNRYFDSQAVVANTHFCTINYLKNIPFEIKSTHSVKVIFVLQNVTLRKTH